QSQIHVRTKLPSIVAPVTYIGASPVSIGLTAQLFGRRADSPSASLTPLFPTSTFTSTLGPGYVNSDNPANVPGVSEGNLYEVTMRAYNGTAWETSTCRGESKAFTLILGGGIMPPQTLVGLQPFSVNCIPE